VGICSLVVMDDTRPRPVKGEFWRHWKHGHLYEIAGVSKDEAEPHTVRVAYRDVHAPPDEIPWSRTLEDFMSYVPPRDAIAFLGTNAALRRFVREP
jgi:hypothetical protein